MEGKAAVVNPRRCTDCYVCLRNKVCRLGALEPGPLQTFADVYGHVLSDPTETTVETGVPGRGTEEAKTNDVTGRVRPGEVGVAIDMGRPGVGVFLRDVEKVARAVCAAGLVLEPGDVSPLGKVLKDLQTGEMLPEVRDKYLLSVIIEGKTTLEGFPAVIGALKEVETQVGTVFSVGIILRVEPDGRHPLIDRLTDYGLPRPIRGKVNVGLGRPLITD
ncbi:MAG: (4Fe-4S)-binding protein [Bacillota bacterium]